MLNCLKINLAVMQATVSLEQVLALYRDSFASSNL
jgi:hypothetical protein